MRAYSTDFTEEKHLIVTAWNSIRIIIITEASWSRREWVYTCWKHKCVLFADMYLTLIIRGFFTFNDFYIRFPVVLYQEITWILNNAKLDICVLPLDQLTCATANGVRDMAIMNARGHIKEVQVATAQIPTIWQPHVVTNSAANRTRLIMFRSRVQAKFFQSSKFLQKSEAQRRSFRSD